MTRSCHQSAPADGQTGFILIILLAGIVYAHHVVIEKALRYATFGAAITAFVIGIGLIIKLMTKLKLRHGHNNADMAIIDTMTGLEFETYIAILLQNHGFNNVRMTEIYDYGVDIIAEKAGVKWGIQVKRYSGLVKAEAVRQVVTALNIYKCDKAMVITNSTFSQIATKLADSNDCVLIDRPRLSQLMLVD